MAKLLDQICEGAVDAGTDIGEVLRRALVLAHRLGLNDLRLWVERELNGYSLEDELPAYRIVHVNSVGFFSGPFGARMENIGIPLGNLPDDVQEALGTVKLTQPAAVYFKIAKETKTGILTYDWPPDVVALLANRFYDGYYCLKASRHVPTSVVVGLVETVRSRLLGFVIELQKESPEAGEAVGPLPAAEQARVQTIFQTHILGTVANLSVGGTNFEQTVAQITVEKGDPESLIGYLRHEVGLGDEDLDELRSALAADPPPKTRESFGPKVSAWMGKIVGKAASGGLSLGVQTAANILAHVLIKFYGL
jgi:AbiTii